MDARPAADVPKGEARLALGTAQLGMRYGIANVSGMPDPQTARAIIAAAWEGGIREFDTARAYGQSERALGDALAGLALSGEARVVTKIDPGVDHLDESAVFGSITASLKILKVPRLHAILAHSERFLGLWDGGLGRILEKAVRQGLAAHAGISLYSPRSALAALDMDGVGFLQVPANLFDRSMEKAAIAAKARERGAACRIRSVYLQGLALMPPHGLPPGLSEAAVFLDRLDALCSEFSVTRREAALGYVLRTYPEALVVVGVERVDQVLDNLELCRRPLPDGFAEAVRDAFQDVPENLLNPSLWNAKRD